MKAKCKTCGKNSESEYCFQHKPRKPLKSKKNIQSWVSRDNAEKFGEVLTRVVEMQTFFLQIWKKRLHISEVSGRYLGREPLSVYFHHILPKEKYPEYAFDEENIILLTLDEHTNVENDMYKYEEVNKRRDQLKLKYERIKQGEKTGDQIQCSA
jgi:hypothetical protein